MARFRKVPDLPKLPSVQMPSIPSPRAKPGWGTTEFAVRKRDPGVGADLKIPDAVGDVPPDMAQRFPGMTRPEWGVWLGMLRNGLLPDIDFIYRHVLMGLGVSYYSTVDYMLPSRDLALEVQGEYWHYMESEREFRDMERYYQLAQDGITLIFVDESDALERPEWVVEEALALRDHSRLASKR